MSFGVDAVRPRDALPDAEAAALAEEAAERLEADAAAAAADVRAAEAAEALKAEETAAEDDALEAKDEAAFAVILLTKA